MDKIRALLEQLGGSKELVDTILESLNKYRDETRATIQEEYHQRLDKAKAICLEEMEGYKRELARKAQIFFESRVEKIEQQIAKQVAIKEAAAESKLQAIAAMLEGVEVNGESNNAELQAARKQIQDLQESVKAETQKNRVLEETARRAQGIAAKTLERNKVLSGELQEAVKKNQAILNEAKVNQAKKDEKPAKQEPAKPITEGKKPATATTTRRTAEPQLAKPRKQEAAAPRIQGGFSPEGIAAGMD